MIMIKEIKNENEVFRTADLATATVVSLHYPLEAIERKPFERKAFFVFKKEPGLDELLEKYYRRELQVEPYQFFEQLSFIKSRLYAER